MSDSVHTTGTVETALRDLAAQSATGCLVVRDPEGDEAHVYLREGGIYAVNVPGRRAMLGVRLVSSGALSPEALSEALEVQRTELEGWRLGELLIHLGYVEPAVVEASVVDHMTDALADLVERPVAAWRFRKRKKTRQDTGPRTSVQALFDDLRQRARAWETILDIIGSTNAVLIVAPGHAQATVSEPNERALLNKVDGRRTISDLAGECGLTLFEASQVVVRLLQVGVLQIAGQQPRAAGARPGGGSHVVDHGDPPADERALWAEADRRAAQDREREEAERRAEALRKAEAKHRAELERQRVAAERRRDEAERAEALELQRLAAARKQEQADRIRAAAAERDELAARQRQLIEEKRLEDAELLHRELEALAAKESAAREAAAEAKRQAEIDARRVAAEAAERHNAAQETARVASAEAARRAAEEVAQIAREATARSVGEEAERITREHAERGASEEAAAAAANQRRGEEDRAGQGAVSAQASTLLTQLSQPDDARGSLGAAGSLVPARTRTEDGRAVNEITPAQPQPAFAAGQSDTAMLLRELSSLNFGNDDVGPTSAPAPRPAERAAPPALAMEPKPKKRKGLFGRG